MNGMCDLCDKPSVLNCPDCDLEVCEDHSRSGQCIYCTKEGITINRKVVEFLEKLEEKRPKKEIIKNFLIANGFCILGAIAGFVIVTLIRIVFGW